MNRIILGLIVLALLSAPVSASAEEEGRCPNGRSKSAATWLSIGHPGLGEWYLKGWGDFWAKAPQKKFWLGFIPIYGWPGYLQVRSAIDAHHCRTHDNL